MNYEVTVGDQSFSVDVEEGADGGLQIHVDGRLVEVDARFPEAGVLHLLRGGEAIDMDLQSTERGWDVTLRGNRYPVEVLDERSRALRALGVGPGATGGGEVVSTSMPGKVVALLVAEGDEVEAGQGLVVVEAMKMENELCASAEGRVEKVCVSQGDAVEGGTALLVIGGLE